MQKYIKIAHESRGKIPGEWIACELCHGTACEFHHIMGRRGNFLNDKHNLIAVCRYCHIEIHSNNTPETRQKLLSIVTKIIGE